MAAVMLRRTALSVSRRAHLSPPLSLICDKRNNLFPLAEPLKIHSKEKFFHASSQPSQKKVKNATKKETKETIDPIDFSKFVAKPVHPPLSFEAPLYSLKTGTTTGSSILLDRSIFGVPVRPDILHRVVVWKLACKRTGTARVKTRGEVVGSKQKGAPQKGRGMARMGPKRSPIRRGGGKAHGPRPRDFSFTLQKKVRRFGLRCALAAKFAQNKLIILDDTDLDVHKTKPFKQTLEKSGWANALIVDKPNINVKLFLASRNIPNVLLLPQQRANVYDILHQDFLILHRDTLDYFFQRVNGLLPSVPKKNRKEGRQKIVLQGGDASDDKIEAITSVSKRKDSSKKREKTQEL